MTRNLFFACALMSVAALAMVWALAPDCKGSFCLGTRLPAQTGPDSAEASQVPNAGRELLGESAQVSAPAVTSQAWPSNEDTRTSRGTAATLEQRDELALESEPKATVDLRQDRRATAKVRGAHREPQFEQVDEIREPEVSYEKKMARKAAAAKAVKEWESLAHAALNEPDDELRGRAIRNVAIHRQSKTVAVLNEVAVLDASPDNRLQAIEQLWYSAADGLDSDGTIRSTLVTARDDPDEAISELAKRALADLQALEEAREFN